jgi:hypothetical protein
MNVEPPETLVIIESLVYKSNGFAIEGFLDSAIQLTLLEKHQLLTSLSPDIKVVLIHVLNPYGFAWRRRWNENNIDLNCNFLLSEEVFDGSPKDYPKFNSFLNPNTQYPILQNYPGLDRPSIRYVSVALEEDRSLNFYPYCYAKSAIFVKSDRTLASCNLNLLRAIKSQNIDD